MDLPEDLRTATLQQLREPEGTAMFRVRIPRMDPSSVDPLIEISDDTHGLVLTRTSHREFSLTMVTPEGQQKTEATLSVQQPDGFTTIVVRWGDALKLDLLPGPSA